MIYDKKPYKISLWKDKSVYIVEDVQGSRREIYDLTEKLDSEIIKNHFYREEPVALIGADYMDSPIRAHLPKLTRNLNGTNTLTFQIYYRYYNEENGEFELNPYINLLQNETKVKLFYDGDWIDFLVKQIREDSINYTFSYTCSDQYITELGKTGYEIELDTELENNMGTITELATTILEGTDWIVDEENSDHLVQTSTQTLVEYKLPKGISATIIDPYTENGTPEVVEIPKDEIILICYDSIANKKEKAQFFWVAGGQYTKNDEGIITNSKNYEVDSNEIGDYSWAEKNFHVSIDYFGDMYVSKQYSKFFLQIGKVCTKWERGGEEYWGFEETTYATIAEIRDILTNGSNFSSDLGWVAANSDQEATVKFNSSNNTIEITPTGSADIVNTGIYDNRASFGSLAVGQRYFFYIDIDKPLSISSITIKSEKDGMTKSFFDETEGPYNITFSDGNQRRVYQFEVLEPCSQEEFLTYTTNLVITFNNNATITESAFFRAEKGKNKQYIFPNSETDSETGLSAVSRVKLNLFKEANLKPNGKDITSIEELVINYQLDIDDGEVESHYFSPIYDKTCEQVRSIEGSKSNRFNLIQELCETFECWVDFIIDHDVDGRPLYTYETTSDKTPIEGKVYYLKVGTGDRDIDFDEYAYPKNGEVVSKLYERRISKSICFKRFIGQDNYAGFRYGINLKGVQRQLDSNQIVTKMIVEENANQYAPNGSCSIQQATMNPSGETSMWNFNYFINQGLLDKESLYRDLYGDGLGYIRNLRRINDAAEPLIDELAMVSVTYSKLLSEYTIKNALDIEAEANKTAYLETITLNSTITSIYLIGNDWYISWAKKDENGKIIESGSGKWDEKDSEGKQIGLQKNYNDEVKRLVNQYISTSKTQTNYQDDVESLRTNVERYKEEYTDLLAELDIYTKQKEALNKNFYKKYFRFIQEGTWISEDYIDPNLYYMDALQVLYTSAFPKVTYTINVLEISQVEEYENYYFRIGDKTYIEDIEFFGYKEDRITPYREEIVVSQVVYSLDEPSNNTITVQNYKTQFEDLFQRVAAATTSLQYAEGTYDRAADAINDDGTINSEFLKKSLAANTELILSAPNGELVFDQDKGVITAISAKGKLMINSLGILVGTGDKYQTAISAEGINASAIRTGRLDTELVNIYGGGKDGLAFRWDADGLVAYRPTSDSFSNDEYVKFSGNGIEGYGRASGSTLANIFKLDWNGLEINIPEGWSQDKPIIDINKKAFAVYANGSIEAWDGVFQGDIYASNIYANAVFNDDGELVSGELVGHIGTYLGNADGVATNGVKYAAREDGKYFLGVTTHGVKMIQVKDTNKKDDANNIEAQIYIGGGSIGLQGTKISFNANSYNGNAAFVSYIKSIVNPPSPPSGD